jgi:hypothetical protein
MEILEGASMTLALGILRLWAGFSQTKTTEDDETGGGKGQSGDFLITP